MNTLLTIYYEPFAKSSPKTLVDTSYRIIATFHEATRRSSLEINLRAL